MATTFRTDPTTGRTVISSDNQRQSDAQAGEALEYRRDAGNLRPGRESMLNVISSKPGTGYMNFNEFKAVRGMTDTNPYGNDGFFSRVLGIDPRKIDYTSNLGQQGIANISRVAYDRFLNPFAKVSSVTGRPVGGDAATGTPRYGISPGEQTIAGIAREVPRTGLDALVSGIPFIGGVASMFGNRPTRITSMEDYEQQQQALGMGADLYRNPTQFNNLTPEPIPAGKEVASELPTPITFLPDELSGKSPFTSGGVPGVYPSDRRDIDPEMEQSAQTTDGFVPTQIVTLPDGRQVRVDESGRIVGGTIPASRDERFEFGPDGVPKTRFEDITVDGNPLNTGRQPDPLFPMATGAYDAKLDEMQPRSDALRAGLSEAERAELDAIRARNELIDSSIPPISDVISGTSTGQPLNLIPPGFSTIGTNIVSQPSLNYPTFTEMERRRRGNSPIIAQPL